MKTFLRLPYRLKRKAVMAALMAPRVKRRLRTDQYEATTGWLDQRRQPAVWDVETSITIARVAQAAMARMPGSFNCLTRSLTVWWLIGGDQCSRVRFGVSPDDDGSSLRFHAWVEQDEIVINDAADIALRYSAFTSPPPLATEFD